MKILVIYNSNSGSLATKENPRHILEKAFEKIKHENLELEFYDILCGSLEQKLQKDAISGVDMVVAAGGDGTLSSVVNKMQADTHLLFGVIPCGTFNNFSRDAGIPLRLKEAVANLFEGKVISIDTAEVNGHIFINNSSVGLYPNSVRRRKHRQYWWGQSKKKAMAHSLIETFFKFSKFTVKFEARKYIQSELTPFVFVGNNHYSSQLLNIGNRRKLTSGKLGIFYSTCQNRMCLAVTLLLSFFGKADNSSRFASLSIDEIKLNIPKKKIDVSADGEVLELTPPLVYKIRPGSLKLIVPRHKNL